MSRYVDIDEITKDIKTFQDSFVVFAGATGGRKIVFTGRPADVRENIHGHWEDGNNICPKCGEDKFKGLDADIYADWQPNFCPNCGASMREPKGEKGEI